MITRRHLTRLTFAPTIALVLCAGCGAAKRQVAVVNGEAITEDQLLSTLLKRHGPQALDSMIEDLLIEQAAREAEINVTDAEIEEKIDDLRARYPSPEDFSRAVGTGKEADERLKQHFEHEVMRDKLAMREVSVSDEECKAHYEHNKETYLEPEKVRLRDMEFADKESATSVLKALKAGGDFAALAKQLTTDPATKDSGGDMGLLPVDSLQPHIRAAADKLEPGEISGAFEGMGAWYVLKLEERVKQRQRPFSECRKEIRDLLTRNKHQESKAGLLKRLRDKAKIKYRDPNLAPPGLDGPSVGGATGR